MSTRWRVPALAGVALLAGLATGGGTFALWTAGSAVPNVVVSSGNLDIETAGTTWTETSADVEAAPHTIDPNDFLVREGDTVEVRYEFTTHLQGDNMLGELSVDWDEGAPSLPTNVTGTYAVYRVQGGADAALTDVTNPPTLGDTVTLDGNSQQIDAGDAGRTDTFAVVVELDFTGMPDRFDAGSTVQTADLGQLQVTLEQTRTGVGF